MSASIGFHRRHTSAGSMSAAASSPSPHYPCEGWPDCSLDKAHRGSTSFNLAFRIPRVYCCVRLVKEDKEADSVL